jgi:ABC-type multidrug transport system fused ATPase/permease subunit
MGLGKTPFVILQCNDQRKTLIQKDNLAKNSMQFNKIMITVLVVLILTSSVSFFGQDSFSAYARHGNYKKIQHDNHVDSSHKIIKQKVRHHKIK